MHPCRWEADQEPIMASARVEVKDKALLGHFFEKGAKRVDLKRVHFLGLDSFEIHISIMYIFLLKLLKMVPVWFLCSLSYVLIL